MSERSDPVSGRQVRTWTLFGDKKGYAAGGALPFGEVVQVVELAPVLEAIRAANNTLEDHWPHAKTGIDADFMADVAADLRSLLAQLAPPSKENLHESS